MCGLGDFEVVGAGGYVCYREVLRHLSAVGPCVNGGAILLVRALQQTDRDLVAGVVALDAAADGDAGGNGDGILGIDAALGVLHCLSTAFTSLEIRNSQGGSHSVGVNGISDSHNGFLTR